MARILATNGKQERLMGYAELQHNPDWWPVNAAAQAPTPRPAPVAKPATSAPKEVKTPATADDDALTEVREAPKEEPAKEQPAPEKVEPATGAKNIPQMVAAIKATTTVEELKELMAGEKRETLKKLAEQHTKRLSK